MSIEILTPGTEITASKLLKEAYQYYEESGGIIPTSQRKDYY